MFIKNEDLASKALELSIDHFRGKNVSQEEIVAAADRFCRFMLSMKVNETQEGVIPEFANAPAENKSIESSPVEPVTPRVVAGNIVPITADKLRGMKELGE